MANFRKKGSFKQLKEAITKSLERRGLTDVMYIDKMNEYLDFWVLRQELKADIAKRGLTVVDDRGRQSENRSVSLEIQVSRQMMSLWNVLGLKEEELTACRDDDEL